VTVNCCRGEVFACASTAQQVTGVLPIGKNDPLGRSQVTGTVPSTTSLAQVAKETFAPPDEVDPTLMSGSPHSVGGVVSRRRTTNVATAVAPPEPVASQVTVLSASRGNCAGEAGTQSTGTVPLVASVAVTS